MYPFDSLAIITPIVFIVLLVGFPIIGVFAGWKRAAYWGGGNFVFYCIGLIVWACAGKAISTAVMPIVQGMLPQDVKSADISQLINSVIAPAFFIIVMLLANIILVICYYTFAKRLLKLGKYSGEKQNKQDKVEKKQSKQIKVQAQGNTKVYNTKWFNKVVGGVGMFTLMLPITFTTTHAVVLTTTNTSTRQTNSMTSNLYAMLQGVSSNMSWFSYYNGENAGKDYDALFSLITLNNKTISYTDIEGNPTTSDPITAVKNTVSTGVKNVVDATKNVKDISTVENANALATPINKLSTTWDGIMEQCGADVNVLFNSTGISEVVKTMTGSTSITMTKQILEDQFKKEDSVYNRLVKAYTTPAEDGNYYIVTDDGQKVLITPIKNIIETSQEVFNNVVDAVYSMYDSSSLDQESKDYLKEVTAQQIQMLIRVKQ